MSLHKHLHRHVTNAYMKIKKLRKNRTNINILVTTMAIVMIWRGVWGLLDMFVFPNNPFFSYLISVFLGILLLFIDNEELDELESK
ncbi:MAG: hypothetical protein PHR61_04925 [Candidatus Absconditabacteria bacterium]|nr:hypothetical protein [Candidatus Absconditabacteria bacterium]